MKYLLLLLLTSCTDMLLQSAPRAQAELIGIWEGTLVTYAITIDSIHTTVPGLGVVESNQYTKFGQYLLIGRKLNGKNQTQVPYRIEGNTLTLYGTEIYHRKDRYYVNAK